MTQHWRDTDTIGWTERDGAGRAPWAPGSAVWLATAAGLLAVLGVVFFTDVLCPEHRAWVQVLGAGALLAAGLSIAGVLRHSRWAPVGTMVAAALGVAIGLIDAIHAPGRGWLLAALFALAGAGAAVLAGRQLALARWERTVVTPLVEAAPQAAPVEAPRQPATEASQPVAEPVDASRPG
jgi:hypothetical protein